MSEATSTSPEAVAQLRSALDAWATDAVGIVRQATAAAAGLVDQTEREVRARSTREAALEAALQAASDDSRERIRRELLLATAALESARVGLVHAQETARAAQALQRRIVEATSGRVPRAAQALKRKLDALGEYAAVPIPSSAATSGAGSNGSDFGVAGIVDVPIEKARFDDNPILDGFSRGGASISDYRWAVETWETVVRPGVLAGKNRDDFARRDTDAGRHSGFRRTAGVYDMFLGSDPIHFTRRTDGTLDVASGRHRVEVARQLGITHLPGRLHG